MAEFDVHASPEMALNARYRGHLDMDWAAWVDRHAVERAEDIAPDAEHALIRRVKGNGAGLGDKRGLVHLVAGNVDQPMLEEIARLDRLERLELSWPVMATDLAPLARLTGLRHLSIDSPRKITDFALLARMPALRKLFVTNAKHLAAIDWLADAHHLQVIGIEGAMDSNQRIEGLAPLAGLQGLEAFFGTSLKLGDPDLMPLARCPRLRFLGVARLAPRARFDALSAARPDISCAWFDDAMWRKPGLRRA